MTVNVIVSAHVAIDPTDAGVPAIMDEFRLVEEYDGGKFGYDVLADVIAVHGIGADPKRTWTKNNINWLRDEDMLPLAAPQSRIFRFGYHSSWLGSDAIQTRISTISDQLLRAILRSRKDSPKRPIVLLGHCFGGLVIEKAILMAQLMESTYPHIAKSIAGLITLGTPHQGSGSQPVAAMLAKVASILGVGEESRLLGLVSKDSEMLQDIVQEFSSFARSQGIPVFCFFEQVKSDITKPVKPYFLSWWSQKEMIVDETSACLQGVPRSGLACDHFQLNRFERADDPVLLAIQEQISTFVEQAPKVLQAKAHDADIKQLEEQLARQNLRDDESLSAIFLSDPVDDFSSTATTKGVPVTGTAMWILDSCEYLSWRSDTSKQILWLNGSPGKGKTMLMMSLAETFQAEQQTDSTQMSSFFLCDRGDDRRNTATAILRGLIYHILCQAPAALRILKKEHDKQKGALLTSPNAIHTLWRILQEIIAALNYATFIIAVDGLDECDEQSSSTFLKLIMSSTSSKHDTEHQSRRLSTSTSGTNIKWLITSRREETYLYHLDEGLQINLEKHHDHVNETVISFIRSRTKNLAEIKKYDASLYSLVEQTLLQKSEGTFLWVSLAFSQLAKPKVKAIHTARLLSDLPNGIVPLYQQILQQIIESGEDGDPDDSEYVRAILRAMAISFRPLTLPELAIMANLPKEFRSSLERLMDFVQMCGSMVEMRRETVHFVHSSARAFIGSIDGITSKNAQVDHTLAASLAFEHLCSVDAEQPRLDDMRMQSFERYPAAFWNKHAQLANTSHAAEVKEKSTFLDEDSRLRDSWFDFHWQNTRGSWEKKPHKMTLSLVMAYACIPDVMELVLRSKGANIFDERDSDGNDATIWASKGADLRSVRLLLSAGADVLLRNGFGETALHFASNVGSLELVRELCTNNADINAATNLGWTPLHGAANLGYKSLVEFFTRNGATVDVKDNSSWTALQRSSSDGQLAIMQSLLDASANIEVRDREGMSPLATAAWNGHTKAVELLLARGARIQSVDYEGWTALHHACWNGKLGVVRLLVEKKANIHARNEEGCTALFQATWNGHTSIVRFLLEHGADVNAPGNTGETALQQAAWAGHTSIVELCLDHGAEINATNEDGATALHQASCNGQEDAVELLLQRGADSSIQTADGQTAYEQAEENSYETTAKVFIERGSPMTPSSAVSSLQGMPDFVDPAVATVLGVDYRQCLMQPHGHACSSKSWKLTVTGGARKHYFLKTGPNENMFIGEHASLHALKDAVPSLCPTSLAHGKLENSDMSFLLTEFIIVGSRLFTNKPAQSLAQKLAKLHTTSAPSSQDGRFGFHMTTFAGPVPQRNTWMLSWAEFYAKNRLRGVCAVIAEKYQGEEALVEHVERVITHVVPALLSPGHLGGSEGIRPSLVHGDLWSGNKTTGVIDERDGVQHYIFDASCCYAHSEYELALMRMFGGFSAGFFSEYHRLVPKTTPVEEYEDRMMLYQLYHWLVNYAITGGGFKEEATACMDTLLAKFSQALE